MIHNFYYADDGDEETYAHDKYERCLLFFNNQEELETFKLFAQTNWSEKEKYSEDIWIPYMEQIPGYNMDEFQEQYKNVQILRRMLEEFRRKYASYPEVRVT